jgi:predicted cupin superfamily sugar epimerase
MRDRPELAEQFDLEPHPEGGWYRQTWRSPVAFVPPGYPGARAAATAIYFLLCPGERSRPHVVRSDELWLWHRGGRLRLIVGDGTVILDERNPQALVPGGTWQSAEPATDQAVLVTCVVAPGFDFADFTMASSD